MDFRKEITQGARRKPPPTRKEKIMAIREARKSLGWTQRKLSEEFGIPLRTIENWEGGKNKCPEWAERLIIEKLERIAKEQ